MVTHSDSMPAAACNTDTFVGSFPEKTNSDMTPDPFRGVCGDPNGMTLDHVIRVIDALEEHGGSRELGDLIAIIGDAPNPSRVLTAMTELGLICFDAVQPLSPNSAVHRLV